MTTDVNPCSYLRWSRRVGQQGLEQGRDGRCQVRDGLTASESMHCMARPCSASESALGRTTQVSRRLTSIARASTAMASTHTSGSFLTCWLKTLIAPPQPRASRAAASSTRELRHEVCHRAHGQADGMTLARIGQLVQVAQSAAQLVQAQETQRARGKAARGSVGGLDDGLHAIERSRNARHKPRRSTSADLQSLGNRAKSWIASPRNLTFHCRR